MGRASGKKQGVTCSYIVGRYKEAGNVGGLYTRNVLEGSFGKELCNKIDDLLKDLTTGGGIGDTNKHRNSNSSSTPGGTDNSNEGNSESSAQKEKNEGGSAAPFDHNGLEAHNIFRNIHGSAKMKIDPTLSRDAELYAKELVKIGKLKHSQLGGIGENLAYGCSSEIKFKLSAAEATKRW